MGETLSIGDAAAASGLSTKTIRYYEDVELIPKARRSNTEARTGGDRVYDDTDIGRLRFIRHARMLGLGLESIRDLLKLAEHGCPGRQPEYHQTLERHLSAIEERIQHLLGLRTTIQQLLANDHTSCGTGTGWTRCGCMGMDEPQLEHNGPAGECNCAGCQARHNSREAAP